MRPFLKWAGGKRQLLPTLRRYYPRRFHGYHEPFVGSGAVYFDLVDRDAVRRRPVRLTDVNADVIGCYLRLRDTPDAVIAHLDALERDHRQAPEAHYYRIRDDVFNPGRAAIFNGAGPRPEAYTAELAAMLIYLNRTGFNGLFRLNARGMFNVPRGRYVNPRICDAANLRRVAAALAAPTVTIRHAPYDVSLEDAGDGDFVYLDPPYAPLSATARFTAYTAAGFTSADQRRLQQLVVRLAARGCHVLLSNSTAPEVATLYDGNAEATGAGLRAYRYPARRAINANARRRGRIMEYVITNIPAEADTCR